MPTLIDGREVDSSSMEWRIELEARSIAKLPTLAERRAWLEVVEARRGKEVADHLRAVIAAVWKARP